MRFVFRHRIQKPRPFEDFMTIFCKIHQNSYFLIFPKIQDFFWSFYNFCDFLNTKKAIQGRDAWTKGKNYAAHKLMCATEMWTLCGAHELVRHIKWDFWKWDFCGAHELVRHRKGRVGQPSNDWGRPYSYSAWCATEICAIERHATERHICTSAM
jgi:hypothetical protein